MQYMLMVYETAESMEAHMNPDDDALWGPWRAYHQALLDAGLVVGGDALHPVSTATTVRVRDGRRQVQDGPYADTKELLGGIILLDLPSLDAALEWAARCPAALDGAVEVRPVASFLREHIEDYLRAQRDTHDG